MIRRLLARRYTRFAVDGHPYNIRCLHRSHWLRLPCLRYRTYDSLCPTHLPVCWDEDDCRTARRARARRQAAAPAPTAGWLCTRTPTNGVHVHPDNDLLDHDLDSDDCVCGPRVEPVQRLDGSCGWLHTHHSLDGRETRETTRRPA